MNVLEHFSQSGWFAVFGSIGPGFFVVALDRLNALWQSVAHAGMGTWDEECWVQHIDHHDDFTNGFEQPKFIASPELTLK